MAGSPNSKKAISLSNLEKFKELCDQTYAKTGGSGGGTQLYRHTIRLFLNSEKDYTNLIIINTSANQYSSIEDIDLTLNGKIVSIFGNIGTSGQSFANIISYNPSPGSFSIEYVDASLTIGRLSQLYGTFTDDTVTPL